MSDSVIELQEVWKIYRMGEVEVPALRGLSLRVEPGEFVSIMGPSGSGKSTAMNLIGCLDTPTRGSVLLEGHDIAQYRESDLARIRGRKIGFVFQRFNLYPTLSAIENVELPLSIHEYDEKNTEKRAHELLERVGLGDRAHHMPSQLSGGEAQRVAVARALSTDPAILLADEPTGNLDSKAGEEVMDLFRELHRKGATVIVVTHEPDVAKAAKRVIWVRDGRAVDGGAAQ